MSELRKTDIPLDNVQFSYDALRGKIVEVCGRNKVFADRMGISEASLSSKLAGKVGFSQEEIVKACRILGITDYQIVTYFFDVRV